MNQSSQQEKTITLHRKQFDAFDFTTQFGAAVAGHQSGKTFLGAVWSAKKMQEFPKGVGLIISPTYKMLESATAKKLFELFPGLRRHYHESKSVIELPTGGFVYLRSAENPFSYEGITANWIWLDEGGLTNSLAWTTCRGRVSMTGGQVLITTTPYNMGWLYQEFFMPWKERKDANLTFVTWASIDNPMFPTEFYEAERKRLRPEEFARRYQGEFKKMAGLVWDVPERAVIQPIDGLAQKSQRRIVGVDWGFRNPAAIVVLYEWDLGWYLVDEWKMPERTTAEIIVKLKNLISEHKATSVYADPAEPDRIEECKRAGIPVYEANKDVEGGVSYVKQLLYEGRLKVYDRCTAFLDEASMYHYPEPKPGQEQKEAKEVPEKFNDHLCDALRYALFSAGMKAAKYGEASGATSTYYPEIGL